MFKLPRSQRRLGLVLACVGALATAGCASWGTHPDSIDVCQRGFAKDPDWARARGPGFKARMLWTRYPSFEFEGRTTRPAKASTLWFRNEMAHEVASCSMHSCDTGRCVWRVRLFSLAEGQWRLRSEYDLGQPRKVTGRQ